MERDASRSLYIAALILTGFNIDGKHRSNRLGAERCCWVTDQILATNQALSCLRGLAGRYIGLCWGMFQICVCLLAVTDTTNSFHTGPWTVIRKEYFWLLLPNQGGIETTTELKVSILHGQSPESYLHLHILKSKVFGETSPYGSWTVSITLQSGGRWKIH